MPPGLTATGTHMGHVGSYSVTCHSTEMTFPLLPEAHIDSMKNMKNAFLLSYMPQPKMVLDLAIPEGYKTELT